MRFVQSDLCCRLVLTRLPLSQETERNGRFRKNEVTSGRRQAEAAAERGDLLVVKVFHTWRQQRGNGARPNSQGDTKGGNVFYSPRLPFLPAHSQCRRPFGPGSSQPVREECSRAALGAQRAHSVILRDV